VDFALSDKERPPHEDAVARATIVLTIILQELPAQLRSTNRVGFIELEELLHAGVSRFCRSNPYPTFEMICAKGPVKPFEIEE
jgi:hypothetical protein